ncbi:tRNA lysidine(34) synthetase TilS [Ruegeria profundi]|uniref:tRNA lysidine(34) synthetase TilS n=1 Tax=Ruegeria profundi TaxID=1685378 RepID=UPI003C7D6E52
MFLTPPLDTLTSDMRARLPDRLPERMGIAVSGGGDSVALMHLLHRIASDEGVALFAATVDHGLRAESADEARMVAKQAAALGIPHEILSWQGWDGAGNLQDQARQARYALLTEWAKRNDISAITLGHTADDQAETLLMRLARSAGVTGLSGMPSSRTHDGIDLLRPMLGITRDRLRAYLTEIGAQWVEDPSNQDTRFDRIKARQAVSDLEPLGISAETLTRVADNLTQAREALERYAQDSAQGVATVDAGSVVLDRDCFAALPEEIRRRVLVGAVSWIAGPGYPPRQSTVDQALQAILNGGPAAIGGCLLFSKAEKQWICREFNAVDGLTAKITATWDARWVLSGPDIPGAEIRALGENGLQMLPDWRATGRPRLALQASPAVWRGDILEAAPLAGFANGWSADMAPDWPEFHASFLSH